MKNFFTLILLIFAVSAAIGCSGFNKAANSDEGKAMENKNERSNENQTEPASSNVSPDDIDLNKPISAGDLREAVFGDFAAWKGKKVLVSARYYTDTYTLTKDGKKKDVTVNLTVPEKAESAGTKDLALKCIVKEEAPKDYTPTEFKTADGILNVKGTITKIEDLSQINLRTVELRPCEINK